MLRLIFGASALLLAAQPAAAQDGVAAECGGVGVETRQAQDGAAGWTLRVEVAQADGSFLGDFSTRVSRDGDVVLEAACDGPWLLARLPPGTYTVEAAHGGETKTQSVEVREGAQAVETFVF